MVEHCGPGGPIQEAKIYPWGDGHTRSMQASTFRDCLWGFTMQGEDMPQASNRVDLDPHVRDVRGFPVARMTYTSHLFERTASAHYGPRLAAILDEMGAAWTVTTTSPDPSFPYGGFISPVPNSKHVMGTTRMGTDSSTSVVDPYGRVHEIPNVVVADSSVFVTSSGYGPTLTLVALALRAGRALAGS
jgi:gluconate 2-dehydrogenase alpha chain